MAVADGVRSCLGRSMSCVWQSMSSAPPGPFPLSAMLAVGIAIAGVAVASVAVDDANELLGKGNMVSVIAIVSMAVLMVTPLLVAVYGLYCRCIFLRDLPTEDEKQEARESRGRLGRVLSCTRGCAYSIAVFLLHLLTIASLAISVALVLIMGTGFIVSLAGDEGCSQAKQKPQPAPVITALHRLPPSSVHARPPAAAGLWPAHDHHQRHRNGARARGAMPCTLWRHVPRNPLRDPLRDTVAPDSLRHAPPPTITADRWSRCWRR